MKRIITLLLLLMILVQPVYATTNKSLVIEKANVEEITEKGDITKVLSDVCQINNKIYYIGQSEEKDYITNNYTYNLFVIDNNEIKNFGDVSKLLNIKEGEVLYFVDMVRVKDMLILVTNARLFAFNFDTNKFDYLDWQTDDDIFQDPISSIDLIYKLIDYTWRFDEPEGTLTEEIQKDIGWIKNAYVSDDFLYLHIEGFEWVGAMRHNTLLRLRPEFPQYREFVGRQSFNTDHLTINSKDNIYVREVTGKLKLFSVYHYNKTILYPFYEKNKDNPEVWHMPPATSVELEDWLLPDRRDLIFRHPLFYGNKLLAQTKEGIIYFDLDKIKTDNNEVNILITESNDISFKDKAGAAYIVNWAIGQDGCIYTTVGESLSSSHHGYERILKITPPYDWEP